MPTNGFPLNDTVRKINSVSSNMGVNETTINFKGDSPKIFESQSSFNTVTKASVIQTGDLDDLQYYFKKNFSQMGAK